MRFRVVVVAAVLVVGGCSAGPEEISASGASAADVGPDTTSASTAGTGDTGDGATASGEAVDADEDGVVVGPVFETVDGSTFDLGSIEGTDTLLWFWAPW